MMNGSKPYGPSGEGPTSGERVPRVLCAHCAPEPTPSPSQEGSNTGWPVPLLGGVRGGLVGARFMGKELSAASPPNPARSAPREAVVENVRMNPG